MCTQMKSANVNPFEYTFTSSHKAAELQELYKPLPSNEEDISSDVSIAGRIMVVMYTIQI